MPIDPPATDDSALVDVAPAQPESTLDDSVVQQYTDLSYDLVDSFNSIAADARAYDIDAVGAGCARLSDLAGDGLALEDVGIPEVDSEWDRAMSAYQDGGQICAEAVADGDSAELALAVSRISAGNTAISAATAALRDRTSLG